MDIIIEIAKEYNKWNLHQEIDNLYFSKIIYQILSRFNHFLALEKIEISVLLADDEKLKQLNTQFRGKEKSTNVLSFPARDCDLREAIELPIKDGYMYLGDIALSYQTVAEESAFYGVSFDVYLKHLIIHSILHLIGYDHETDEEADEMESLEVKILESFGCDNFIYK